MNADLQTTTIIGTGAELVCGRCRESNSGFIARALTEQGFSVRGIHLVGDGISEIAGEIRCAVGKSAFVIVTGGLGPTEDDCTRRAIAKVAGKRLAVRKDVLRRLEDRLKKSGRQPGRGHVSQAEIPGDGRVFENPVGTACGFCCEVRGTRIIALPGVPAELQAILTDSVLPFMRNTLLEEAQGLVMFAGSQRINVFGIPESEVNERIIDMMEPGRNPELGICVDNGSVSISVTARAASGQDADALVDADVRRLKSRFGESVYGAGDTTMAGSVAELLQRGGLHVSVAESCTGGLIGDMLVDVPGISACFLLDVVAYSDGSKKSVLGVSDACLETHGAVSAETAGAMARGVCSASGSELGISTTGIAGPSGGMPAKPVGLVYIGICLNGESRVFRHELKGRRRQIRQRAARLALNHARLALLKNHSAAAGPER